MFLSLSLTGLGLAVFSSISVSCFPCLWRERRVRSCSEDQCYSES
ncbi:unnamed protein product [Tuber melanosporum]|uniref:(Perigord truffle) hypothetical protein n=1 Tax=Tuber melanosporum (strain Mel28) TaxID=656061 RepID=D5G5J2_TUBMM|nr:uncharacterized protein GSTUM_00004361001 [Tuber melanosporum]CAZ79785.1 unnamed protein product [Tuber melanosporum]